MIDVELSILKKTEIEIFDKNRFYEIFSFLLFLQRTKRSNEHT